MEIAILAGLFIAFVVTVTFYITDTIIDCTNRIIEELRKRK